MSVRVRLNNPGAVSDAFTASAVIGNYTSYGQSPVSMPASSIVYATGSGTVNDFTLMAGSTVTRGQTLCTVESETIRDQIENARLSLQSAQLSAGTASDSVEDYNITSPIAGTVIEKNFKAGDKVDGASSGTLAVIYDLSYLELEMAVDELDIGKVQVGQRVEITADAVEGQTFEGVVDKISINGTTANGFTSYPVTIVIEDYGDLKPGMNVSASIIGEGDPQRPVHPRGRGGPGQHGDGSRPRRPQRRRPERGGHHQAGDEGDQPGPQRRRVHRGHRRPGGRRRGPHQQPGIHADGSDDGRLSPWGISSN